MIDFEVYIDECVEIGCFQQDSRYYLTDHIMQLSVILYIHYCYLNTYTFVLQFSNVSCSTYIGNVNITGNN